MNFQNNFNVSSDFMRGPTQVQSSGFLDSFNSSRYQRSFMDYLNQQPANSLNMSDMGGVGTEIADMNIPSTDGTGAFGGHGWFSKEGLFGGKNEDGSSFNGWGGSAIGLATGAMNAYLGMKNLGIMEDSLKFQKNAFSKQFENQRITTNTALRDRQQRRVDAQGRPNSSVMSVDEYMRLNGV